MKELFDEQLSQHFKNSFEDFSPTFDEADWQEVSKRLDSPKGFNKRFLIVFAVAASSLFAMTNNATLVLDTSPFTTIGLVESVLLEGVDKDAQLQETQMKDGVLREEISAIPQVEATRSIDSQVLEKEGVSFFRPRKKNGLIAHVFEKRRQKREFAIEQSRFYTNTNKSEGRKLDLGITSEMCYSKNIDKTNGGLQRDMSDLIAYQDFTGALGSSEVNSTNQFFLKPSQELSFQVFGNDADSPNTFSFSQEPEAIEHYTVEVQEAVSEKSNVVESKEEAQPIVQTAHFSWEVKLQKSGLSISPFIKAPLPNSNVRNLDRYLAGGFAISVPIQ